MAFTANNSLRLNAQLTGPGDLGVDTSGLNMTVGMALSDGTGANEADLLFKDTRPLTASQVDDIDLTSVTDAFGNALAAAEIVSIYIRSLDTNTTNLTIGGSSADFGGLPGQTIAPGGVMFLHNQTASGLGAVVDSTSDIIRVTNGSGASASYEIVVIGRSA